MEFEELTNAQLKALLKRLNLPTFGKTKVDFITTLQFATETPEELDQIIEELVNSDENFSYKKSRKSKSEIAKSSNDENNHENLIPTTEGVKQYNIDPFFRPFNSDFQKYQECILKQPKKFNQNTSNKRRYYEFRILAYYLAREFSELTNIEKIAIIGSIARPLIKEPPHFKRNGDLEWHYSKDLDLAVWFNAPINGDILREIQKRRMTGLSRLATEMKITFAHHQIEIFCFNLSNLYLGRLCEFITCPKPGKEECFVPNCGKIPFLQQHRDFRFNMKSLESDQIVMIYKK